MFSYLERASKFFKRNVFRNTAYLLNYALAFPNPALRLFPTYLSDELLNKALLEGRSLIRLGDGEIHIMNYGSIHYQDFHPQLREYFLAMIRDYTPDAPYLLGVPQTYLGMSNRELCKKRLFHCWLPFKVSFQMLFNTQASYFDAHIFYRGEAFLRTLEKVLNNKKIFLVTSQRNWELVCVAGIKNHLTVEHILCPEENAFARFEDIARMICERVADLDVDNFRVLISAGPASKALVYVLSKQGIVSYDLGRGIEIIYTNKSLEGAI